MNKKWYLSKSVWIHGLQTAGGLLVLIAPNLPASWTAAGWVATASGAIALGLRLITGTPIAGSPADTASAG
ncbi:MAG TPA: hypothetical protein VLC46_20320 [Thermoanaerobaculia bacterium]|jgi:hypothetical protein|nr:hypothetical protein [Thermoanaerobaculia bacterium]